MKKMFRKMMYKRLTSLLPWQTVFQQPPAEQSIPQHIGSTYAEHPYFIFVGDPFTPAAHSAHCISLIIISTHKYTGRTALFGLVRRCIADAKIRMLKTRASADPSCGRTKFFRNVKLSWPSYAIEILKK